MTGCRILQISILWITAFEIIMQDLVYEGRRLPFVNLQDFKEVITNKWKEVSIETVQKSNAQWKRRLNAVKEQNDGAVQHIFRKFL